VIPRDPTERAWECISTKIIVRYPFLASFQSSIRFTRGGIQFYRDSAVTHGFFMILHDFFMEWHISGATMS
jgi:hypothetical protein